jgi:glycosyltransferase involved in cell wall biosynthesis
VTLAGWVEHARLPGLLAEADLFTFPSVREFGGGVVLEAMAVGLVPVIVDYAGPAELVTPETGYAVPLGTRAEIVERLGALLARLAERPGEIDEKSRAAARRVREHFTWPVKAGKVVEVYRWVTGRAARPEFPMPTP